jgi:hypothetical protein
LTQKNATSCGMQGQACKGEIGFYWGWWVRPSQDPRTELKGTPG